MTQMIDTVPRSPEFVVYMESEEYGRERFAYDSESEALAGMKRLKAKVREMADGVDRVISYVGEEEQEDEEQEDEEDDSAAGW